MLRFHCYCPLSFVWLLADIVHLLYDSLATYVLEFQSSFSGHSVSKAVYVVDIAAPLNEIIHVLDNRLYIYSWSPMSTCKNTW